jgi:hypothetical protein
MIVLENHEVGIGVKSRGGFLAEPFVVPEFKVFYGRSHRCPAWALSPNEGKVEKPNPISVFAAL